MQAGPSSEGANGSVDFTSFSGHDNVGYYNSVQ